MEPVLPRVAITYCTQCKWMLRAGYFGQELLSTFGTTIGEIALIPATGGIFQVHLTYKPVLTEGSSEGEVSAETVLLWDRKTEGGFPETKILKQRVRDHLDPQRNLGHSDTPSKKAAETPSEDRSAAEEPSSVKPGEESVYIEIPSRSGATTTVLNPDGTVCEDCS